MLFIALRPHSHYRDQRGGRGAGAPAIAAFLACFAAGPSHAQIIQQWTHKAAFGDASAAVAMGDTLMFVANNEDEILRLYKRYPGTACPQPIYSLNVRDSLDPTSSTPHDLESGVKLVDANGTRIYWLGSHSNTKTGNLRPNRYRLFATQVNGDGSGSPPYTLTYVGRYDHLRTDLIAWDKNGLHGLGADYFGLEASAASGVNSTSVNGFTIEGLAIAPDGTTAYLGFRTPFVNGFGPTTPTSQRGHALIVPLLNMPALVTANPTPGPGAAQFGAPILLNLGVRGVRSIDSSQPNQYLITAGPADDPSNPPAPPLNFRLFTWSGNAVDSPEQRATDIPQGYSPEGAIVAPGLMTGATVVQFVSDDTPTCWRSFTTNLGAVTAVFREPEAPGRIRFSRPPVPSPTRGAVSFEITLGDAQPVELSIHDVEGRRVATLWRGVLTPGTHVFAWDGRASAGARSRSGIYYARLASRDEAATQRFALVR